MRQVLWIVIGILLLVPGTLSVQGQELTIVEVLASRSDLSTMAVFLDATRPHIRQQFERSGSYTLFVPNNVAFNNLASSLDMTLQELLQDAEIVTELVQYHTLEGRSNETQIRRLNGQLVPTELPGAFINVRVRENNEISLNNVVEVIETNVNASNGVIHVINDVMLNRLITRKLNNSRAEELITPYRASVAASSTDLEPTATATITTPTPGAQTVAAVANLRFAQFAFDAPSIDMYIDDQARFQEVRYSQVSDYQALRPGTYRLTVAGEGEGIENRLTDALELVLRQGDFVTINLLGSNEEQSLKLIANREQYADLSDGMTQVGFVHTLSEAPAVDIIANGRVIVSALPYGQSASVTLERGTYRLRITEANSDNILIELDRNLRLLSGRYYNIFIMQQDEGSLNILQNQITANTVASLQRGDHLIDEAAVVIVNPALDDDQDVFDRVQTVEAFSILEAALRAADEDLLERLRDQENPVTLLAPTDQAFEVLLSTLDLSTAQFLEDQDLLTEILLYHIVDGRISSLNLQAAAGTSIITSLPENEAFFVSLGDDGILRLNGQVRFAQTNIEASNGIIHVLDAVLLPQSIRDALGLD